MAFQTYKQIVEYFEDAANKHLAVNSFGHGSLDYLDARSQNVQYPYVFLRPLTSPGYNEDTRIKTLSFELYDVLDYQDLINKLIRFYNSNRKDTKKCKRYLTNLERVNESKYKNPKRSGVYPDNNFVLEYCEDI